MQQHARNLISLPKAHVSIEIRQESSHARTEEQFVDWRNRCQQPPHSWHGWSRRHGRRLSRLDIKLERTVALKFLPDELNASDRDKERFLREARTASSLDHPNVGVNHSIEETPDGRTFIVMAFYEGKSLAQRIRAGPVSCKEAVEIALQMAHGPAAAHARQIVHRDIKPSNVMLRLLLALSSGKLKSSDNDKNNHTDFAVLTRSLHIRPMRSSNSG